MTTDSVSTARATLASADPRTLADAIRMYADDGRPGVIDAVQAAQRRLIRLEAESARLSGLAELERSLSKRGYVVIAGVDEVGRGALAGPVSAGACVLPADASIPGLRDSKALSPTVRSELALLIRSIAVASHVAHIPAARIDEIGIARATLLAMREAVAGLDAPVDHVLVDGNDVEIGYTHTAVVKGDATVRAIAAASIIAKVDRDALMRDLDPVFPGYGLAGNKGYGSAEHMRAIADLGPSAIHRRSFSPCAQPSLF